MCQNEIWPGARIRGEAGRRDNPGEEWQDDAIDFHRLPTLTPIPHRLYCVAVGGLLVILAPRSEDNR